MSDFKRVPGWLKKWERKMTLCAPAMRAAEARGLCAIPLTRGMVAIVDPEHYEHLAAHQWIAREVSKGRFYAVRRAPGTGRRFVSIYMHRVVAGAADGSITDHANGDTLDNRAANLRTATPFQNTGNRVMRQCSETGFKGVTRSGPSFRAAIGSAPGVQLGSYATAKEAAFAYDEAARKRWGEFARLNFPRPGERSCHSHGEEAAESGFLKGCPVSKMRPTLTLPHDPLTTEPQ